MLKTLPVDEPEAELTVEIDAVWEDAEAEVAVGDGDSVGVGEGVSPSVGSWARALSAKRATAKNERSISTIPQTSAAGIEEN